jgi:hypothetical protein
VRLIRVFDYLFTNVIHKPLTLFIFNFEICLPTPGRKFSIVIISFLISQIGSDH